MLSHTCNKSRPHGHNSWQVIHLLGAWHKTSYPNTNCNDLLYNRNMFYKEHQVQWLHDHLRERRRERRRGKERSRERESKGNRGREREREGEEKRERDLEVEN